MVWDIQGDILRAAQKFGLGVKVLSDDDKDAVVKQVRRRFIKTDRKGWPLWHDDFQDSYDVQDELAWTWVGEFIKQNDAVLFFNPDVALSAFLVAGGKAVDTLLEETTSVEFYITNRAVDYLLCWNHHDYLIALGSAIPWLQTRSLRGD